MTIECINDVFKRVFIIKEREVPFLRKCLLLFSL